VSVNLSEIDCRLDSLLAVCKNKAYEKQKSKLQLDLERFLFFYLPVSKSLRGKDTNTFMVKKCDNPSVCPVSILLLYIQVCDLMSINLGEGYLFRVTNNKGL
jgi:hypothetical protein